jgi:hypothetical protein
LSGQRFGKLVITGPALGGWAYRCDCGKVGTTGARTQLKRGQLKSCGCSRFAPRGGCATDNRSEHVTWLNMRRRCYNQKNKSFKDYGARGIKVCDRWHDDFEKFFSDMGPRPAGYTLERIDNDASYSPTNCVWAPKLVQASNTRSNRFLEYGGERMTVAQWSRRLGFPNWALRGRLNIGWTIERALTTPLRADSRR